VHHPDGARALDRLPPGRSTEVEWTSRGEGEAHRALVTLQQDPTLAVALLERLAGVRPSGKQRDFRARWLASRAGEAAG